VNAPATLGSPLTLSLFQVFFFMILLSSSFCHGPAAHAIGRQTGSATWLDSSGRTAPEVT
jgi:hypothetical protein